MTDPSLERLARARLGSMLRDKYRLESVLGIGGMATVYSAVHRNQARFAIKMLHPILSEQKTLRRRFLREGYAANSVRHAGAVAVIDDDVADDGSAFLVMELLDGSTVEELWDRCAQRLGLLPVVAIADPLLDVLVAAHANGVIHRDIKPANIFVTREGQIKVLDFGIARARDAIVGYNSGQMTMSGTVVGTPAFMAPEQAAAKSDEIDAQSDVWSVGATMFTLLAGRTVHEGTNLQQLVVRAAVDPAVKLRTVSPDIPENLADVVDRALAFDKARRWPSARAMRVALKRACEETFPAFPGRASLTELFERRPSRRSRSALRAGSGARASNQDAATLAHGAAETPLPILGATTAPVSTGAAIRIPQQPRRRVAPRIAAVAVALGIGFAAVWPGGAPRSSAPTLTTTSPDETTAAIPEDSSAAASSAVHLLAKPQPSSTASSMTSEPGSKAPAE